MVDSRDLKSSFSPIPSVTSCQGDEKRTVMNSINRLIAVVEEAEKLMNQSTSALGQLTGCQYVSDPRTGKDSDKKEITPDIITLIDKITERVDNLSSITREKLYAISDIIG